MLKDIEFDPWIVSFSSFGRRLVSKRVLTKNLIRVKYNKITSSDFVRPCTACFTMTDPMLNYEIGEVPQNLN